MMIVRKRIPVWLLLLVLTSTLPVAAQERAHLTLRDLYASRTFFGEYFAGGRWADEGPIVTYIEAADGVTHVMSYNLETDTRTRLIDGSKLQAPDVNRVIEIEGYDYSADGKRVLLYTDSEPVWRLNTKGFYYVYEPESGKLTPLSDRKKGFQMFAKFSPDGRLAGFVRDRNLFVVDLASGRETQLTADGSDGAIINGTSDWVYEEEFGLRDAWAWSPDSRHIAFIQFDESKTRPFTMADLRGQYPVLTTFRYPKAGEANSEVRVGVIDVAARSKRFIETGTWQAGGDSLEYIPRFGWTPAIDGTAQVWFFRMNRDQTRLDLLYAHPKTGALRQVIQEKSKAWIDVETGFSDLDMGTLAYLDDGRHFVWRSERDGYRHLYLYRNDGTLVRPLTQGNWNVTDFHGVDEANGTVYFSGTVDTPLEWHLYRTGLETGTNGQEPVRLTTEAGWHSIEMSRDFRYYIDRFSNVTTPNIVTLHGADGRQLKVLSGNEALIATLKRYDLAPPEFTQIPGADGAPLNAMIIKPKAFDSTRAYPLLMNVYGGPGSQEVRNAWGGTDYLWHAMLAEEHGVLVAIVDNRGTGAGSYAFKTSVYRRVGQFEAADQQAAARHLGALPYVDEKRIGIWGWSYGGYTTLMSMLAGEGPRTFKLGMAVAPVTDWRLYDTIYIERFMSTPQNNPEGYRLAAPINLADRLSENQRLLIVHGDADDNVHFQNAIQMVDALQKANKQFQFMVYPGRNHGIYGGLTRLHLFTMLTDFVKNNL